MQKNVHNLFGYERNAPAVETHARLPDIDGRYNGMTCGYVTETDGKMTSYSFLHLTDTISESLSFFVVRHPLSLRHDCYVKPLLITSPFPPFLVTDMSVTASFDGQFKGLVFRLYWSTSGVLETVFYIHLADVTVWNASGHTILSTISWGHIYIRIAEEPDRRAYWLNGDEYYYITGVETTSNVMDPDDVDADAFLTTDPFIVEEDVFFLTESSHVEDQSESDEWPFYTDSD
uniref:IgGFc_binding domain-containing protein n=1 Tax=Steinernema glaseri TaxID=37863 RepID=A0A1I8A0F0_9BILA